MAQGSMRGKPVAWTHRVVGPAILALSAACVQDGIDIDG